MSAPEPRSRRLGRRTVVLVAALAGALILIATTMPWITASGLGPTSVSSSVDVAGSEAAQTVTAMGLVALAAAAAVSIARRIARLVIAGLLLAAAAVTLAVVGSIIADPAAAAEASLGDITGTTEAAADYSLRPAVWLAAVGAVLLVGPAVVLCGSRGWPESRRYENAPSQVAAGPGGAALGAEEPEDSAGVGTPEAPSVASPSAASPSAGRTQSGVRGADQDPGQDQSQDADADPFDLWDELSRGDDPTDRR